MIAKKTLFEFLDEAVGPFKFKTRRLDQGFGCYRICLDLVAAEMPTENFLNGIGLKDRFIMKLRTLRLATLTNKTRKKHLRGSQYEQDLYARAAHEAAKYERWLKEWTEAHNG